MCVACSNEQTNLAAAVAAEEERSGNRNFQTTEFTDD
jgi:hypothetical protein